MNNPLWTTPEEARRLVGDLHRPERLELFLQALRERHEIRDSALEPARLTTPILPATHEDPDHPTA